MHSSQKMKNLFEIAITNSSDGEDNTKNDSQLKIGSCIKHYTILEELGRGGMGIVYRAHDTKLNRDVAIKIIIHNTPKYVKKFLEEAKSVAQLNHANIVQIFEVCEDPCFFVMELIEGISLDHFIRTNNKKLKNKHFFTTVVHIFIEIAHALHFTHTHKIIHRDIKPENIMLDKNLHPKIMDFGLAKTESRISIDNFAGTPMYMSPEQARNKKATKQSDLYSLGVTFYECLTMHSIFQGDTVFNILYQIIHNDPINPRLLNPDIPKELEAICLKTLEKKPQKRYASMKMFAYDLQNYMENKPIIAKPISRFGIFTKLVKRNKLAASTIFCIVLAVVLSGYSMIKAHRAELKINREIAKQQQIEKRKTEFLYLKKNLYFAYQNIKNKKLKAAKNDLWDAQQNYINSNFAKPEDCIEFCWLKNKTTLFEYETAVSGNLMFFWGNKLVISKLRDTKLQLCQWEKGWKKKREIDFSKPIFYCCANDEHHLAILHGDQIRIYDKNLNTLAEVALPKDLGRMSICYFCDDTLLIGGYKNIVAYKWKANDRKLTVLINFSGSFGKSPINNTFSFTKNERHVFFVHGSKLYTYDINNDKLINTLSIPNEEIHVCHYEQYAKKILIGTRSGSLYWVKNNYFRLLRKHDSCVMKIESNHNTIVTISDHGQIFIFDQKGLKHDQKGPEQKGFEHIRNDSSRLQDIIIHDNYFSVISLSQLLSYKIPLKKNPETLVANTKADYVALHGNTITTSERYGMLYFYNIKNKTSKNYNKLHRFIYSFKDEKTQNILYINDRYDVFWKEKLLKNQCGKLKFFHDEPIGAIFYKQERLLYLYSKKASVLVWDLDQEKVVDQITNKYLRTHKSTHVLDATLAQDNRYLILAFRYHINEKFLCVIDLKTKKYQNCNFEYYGENVKIAFANIANIDSLVLQFQERICIIHFAKLLQKQYMFYSIEKHPEYYSCFALVQQNERLISIDVQGRMLIWNLNNLWSQKSSRFTEQNLLLEMETNYSIKDCVYKPLDQKLITVGKEILLWKFQK